MGVGNRDRDGAGDRGQRCETGMEVGIGLEIGTRDKDGDGGQGWGMGTGMGT